MEKYSDNYYQSKEKIKIECLLKMVIGMAINGYGYDIKAKKSPIPSEISSDLLEKGISLTPKTIKKYLNEAERMIPINQ